MLWENILRRLDAVKCLYEHVGKINGLSNKDKSSYYRSILIILSSIVEGLAFEIIKKNTKAPSHVFETGYDYKEVCNIKPSVLGTKENVHLYRRNKKDLRITDEGATFARLNLFLKHKGLVSEAQYRTLDWVRRERNKLHVQGLNGSDTDYTRHKVRRAAKAIKFLMTKL